MTSLSDENEKLVPTCRDSDALVQGHSTTPISSKKLSYFLSTTAATTIEASAAAAAEAAAAAGVAEGAAPTPPREIQCCLAQLEKDRALHPIKKKKAGTRERDERESKRRERE